MQLELFEDKVTVQSVPAPEPHLEWELTAHICAFCGGRVLQRGNGRRLQFRCSECTEVGAVYVETLCCCGVRTSDGRRLLECVPNPDCRPGNAAEIVVREYAANQP